MFIDSQHQAGTTTTFLALTLASLAAFFNRIGQPEIAATLYGATTRDAGTSLGSTVIDHLCNTLGTAAFDRCVATGAAMDTADAVRYAHHHIDHTRHYRP